VALRKCLSSTINTAIARRPSSAGTCLGTKSVAVPDGVACVTKDLKLVACGIKQLLALWNSGGQSGRWRCPLFRPRQLGSINSPVPGKPFARQLVEPSASVRRKSASVSTRFIACIIAAGFFGWHISMFWPSTKGRSGAVPRVVTTGSPCVRASARELLFSCTP